MGAQEELEGRVREGNVVNIVFVYEILEKTLNLKKNVKSNQ